MFEARHKARDKASQKKSATPEGGSKPALTNTGVGISFQLFTHAPAATATSEREADAAASDVVQKQSDGTPPPTSSATTAPFGVIVEDDLPLGPGQMHRTPFIESLSKEIERVADEELRATGRSARDCPYLVHWLRFYRERPAAQIERAIQHYAQPEEATLEGLQSAVLARLRTAVRAWVSSGGREVQTPEGVAMLGQNDGLTQSSATGAEIQRKAIDGGDGAPSSADPVAVRAQLRNGHALDSTVRTRMERGFGRSFGDVRLHTDGDAAQLASSFSARAFTIGNDIAFGSGQFRPGTPRGDLMLAHELAHVIQQRGDGEQARGWSTLNEGALEVEADRAAISAVARTGLALEEIARHVDPHPPAEGGGLRLQRCSTPDVDYSDAPAPPDYNTVAAELRELYKKKVELGRADPLDEAALEKVNVQIREKLDLLRLLGVMADEFTIESKLTDPSGPQDLRVTEPTITRSPADGPIYIGRRIRFQLSTDWLPSDEIPHVEWRWKANGIDSDLMYKQGMSCELDEDYWGTFANSPGLMDAREWRKEGGATFYAKIKLGDKPAVISNKIYIPFDQRMPHEIPGFKFEIAPAKSAIVVGEDPNVSVKEFTLRTFLYWVEWTVDGEVANFHPGIGGGRFRRPFDSTGKKMISARLFLKEDYEGKNPLASASTTVEVQDVEATGRQTLAKGEELGLYSPLSDYKKSHDAAMAEMGTRAKLGETGGAKDYWQERLNFKAEQLKKLEEKAPDYKSTTNVAGKDYGTGLTSSASSTPIPTVIVYPSKEQVVQPVSIYLITRKNGEKWTASVLDITGKIYRFDGGERDSSVEAAKSAFEAWKSGNEYPIGGKVVYTFNPTGWTFDKTFSTTTGWKIAEGFLDGLIKAGTYVAIGLLMLAPDATITKVLGYALMAAVAARGVMAISDSLGAGGKLLDKENIIEMVVILTSILGGAGPMLRSAGSAAGGILFRAGNWMVMTSLAVGAGTLVYATAEAIAAIRQALKDPTLTDSERSNRVLSIIGGAIENVTMFVISTRAMLKSGLKASDFFKQTIPKKGAGAIEMTEGMRVDLEVALRNRGVKPEALKMMSNEALIDAYYEVTATRPELVKIPEQFKALKGSDAAKQMNLPNPPDGYQWVKTSSGRLTVAAKKGTKGPKLVYDPEAPPGKQFIREPTAVAPSKVQIARAQQVSPAEVQKSADTAVKAREGISEVPEGKTVARVQDGTTKTSGWGSDVNSLKPVENLSAKIGHQAEPNVNDAPGRPGSYNNSHAEKQLAAAKPGEPIGVSKVMCIDCQIFFAKLAASSGKPVVVSDPAGVRIFLPHQPMVTAPNAAAAAGVVAAANKAVKENE